jgi:hypothetical protein
MKDAPARLSSVPIRRTEVSLPVAQDSAEGLIIYTRITLLTLGLGIVQYLYDVLRITLLTLGLVS